MSRGVYASNLYTRFVWTLRVDNQWGPMLQSRVPHKGRIVVQELSLIDC